MNQPVFYDPGRKRWKRLRRILDVLAVISTILLVFFAVSVIRKQALPELLLPATKRNFKALKETDLEHKVKNAGGRAARRKTNRKPSEIELNTDEGVRAAYYVDDDATSYSSLKEHIHQIDLLFPEWLYVLNPEGGIQASTLDHKMYSIVDNSGAHDIDQENKVFRVIAAAKDDVPEVFPMVNNFNNAIQDFDPAVGKFLLNPAARANFIGQLDRFFTAFPKYRGLSFDFEEVPDEAQDAYKELIAETYANLHGRGLKLYVNLGVSTDPDDLKLIARNTDGIVLMDYDEHEVASDPGPIAGQEWFIANLKNALKVVPKDKMIVAIGNYGYEWILPLEEKGKKAPKGGLKVLNTNVLSVQDAWQKASDANADVHLEDDVLNAHFAYDDLDNQVRHQIWFLDGVTAMNEMRAARDLGLRTFALWRLGSEDRSLWSVWDRPNNTSPDVLKKVPPGHDLDVEGEGDILRVAGTPKAGSRSIQMDDNKRFILDEVMDDYPLSYSVNYYGYQPGKVAFTFDDGPDPKWTPKILDVLKRENVKATFMVIGLEAQDHTGLLHRYVDEGHEIGNHTFTHPDISEISSRQLQLELNLTERLFGSVLGVQPLYFRPPYSIDQEPDTDDQAEPVDRIEKMGYIIVGNKIDTDDWDENPRKSPQEITQGVLNQLELMKTKTWMRGSIILMHDGGGNRQPTVDALPMLIDTLRAKGYEIVSVSDLLGKTRAQVMPPLTSKQKWQARVDSVAFFVWAFFNHFVVSLFFVGDILMTGRLVIIGMLALIDRLRKRQLPSAEDYHPQVAVLVPAYNEEKVIVRTIKSVLNSDYKNLRVIVIDDGSKDRTFEVSRDAYPAEIAAGRLTVLTKPNAGKAEALNFALPQLTEEIYVGIDADTVIAPDAISKLIPHFADAKVGAVAGNAKVGNKVNLWTRWQALEYITSQNFDRRALDLFDVVTVVPGAIGAWRTGPVRDGEGYHPNTVAEDADLTMNLLEQGYKVVYEDQALAFTEAPATVSGLMRQRFRWSFGILQAVFKHRKAFLRHRALGWFALPNILIFQILLPLFSPFIDLMFVGGLVHYLVDRHFHPEAASFASFERLLVYFLTFLIVDFLASSLAFSLERKHPGNKGDVWLLFHIWIQRFTYRQVFSVVLFKTIKRAVDGRSFNWEKLERTAKMSRSTERATAGM